MSNKAIPAFNKAARKKLVLTAEPLVALGVALPKDVEKEVLSFMEDGVGMLGYFSASMLRTGILDLMQRHGHNTASLPVKWPLRIVDALLRREKTADRIEVANPNNRGAAIMWRCKLIKD